MALPKKKEKELNNGNFLFEKVYDGLRSDLTLTNELGGDCLLGQLIEPGFGQLKSNGQHLRAAYIEGSSKMQLFETANYNDRAHEEATYFRSDDQERTLMSAEILLSDLFDMPSDKTVSLHSKLSYFMLIVMRFVIIDRLLTLHAVLLQLRTKLGIYCRQKL